MTRTLIRNVDVITLDEKGTVLRRSSLAISGRTIVGVGQAPAGFEPEEIVDAANHVAIPAFFNAHCHTAMALERGWAEDLSFPRWLNERIWVAESALRPEDVYWGAALAACEMIRGGTAGFNDHYFYMDQVAEVLEQSGMKASLASCVFGIGDEKEIGANLEGTLAFIDRWQNRGDGRLRLFLGPHSPYICPPPFLARVADLAQARKLGIHLHVAESQEQVDKSLREYGRTPVEHLEKLGVLNAPGGCIAAHCLVASDPDLDILARHRVTVAHAPVTYLKLAMGVNNLARFRAKGVDVAIGTDGPASNGDLDMLVSLRQTAVLQKHVQADPRAAPGDLVLRMASQAGARAAGFADSGVISSGSAADIALIDMDRPHLLPRHDLVANVVYCAKAADVTHLMVDGRWLYRQGELLTLDEEKIKAEAERRALTLVGRGMHQVREYQG
ncbi:MAG: amidohydrolase [Anaerolineales bacterium]|jgi:5-methylthioadenosine/S-adenosylhomocysteine deaminase